MKKRNDSGALIRAAKERVRFEDRVVDAVASIGEQLEGIAFQVEDTHEQFRACIGVVGGSGDNLFLRVADINRD